MLAFNGTFCGHESSHCSACRCYVFSRLRPADTHLTPHVSSPTGSGVFRHRGLQLNSTNNLLLKCRFSVDFSSSPRLERRMQVCKLHLSLELGIKKGFAPFDVQGKSIRYPRQEMPAQPVLLIRFLLVLSGKENR